MTTKRIQVLPLAGDTCITLEQGEPIHVELRSILSRGDSVVLDFSGVLVCASPFLNAAIGRLLKDFKPSELDARLQVVGMTSIGQKLLRHVIENSNRYYNDPAARKAVDDILNEETDDSEPRRKG